MASEILAIGTGAANSSDVVVSAGTPVAVALKAAGGAVDTRARVIISLKDDGGAYNVVDEMNFPNRPALVLIGPGSYRFSRAAQASACGVFSG